MHADLTKVRQMLFNLLSNACKFTETGDRSRLRSAHESLRTVRPSWIAFSSDATPASA